MIQGARRRETRMAIKTSADELIHDLHAVIRDAENLLRATASQTGDAIDEVRTRAAESVRQAKDRLADIEGEALKRAQEIAAEADDYVRGNPWQAVGVAALVGLVLGLLVSRR
jgi:ElaB/YqjD/DUF883 family membrane-anchored ribosome-binding protein